MASRMTNDRGEYRSIRRVLLDGPDFQKLYERPRWIFVALKLNAGPTGIDVCYPVALAPQLAQQTGMPERAVRGALDSLEEAGWVRRESNLLWIVGHLKHDPHMQESDAKHRKAVQRHVASLPRLALVAAFVQSQPEWFPPSEGASHNLSWAIEGPSKGHRSTETETERETETEKETNTAAPNGAGLSSGRKKRASALPPYDQVFEEAWSVYPKRPGNAKTGAWRQWLLRVADGAESLDMLEGARRYAAHVTRERLSPRYVLQAQTFFGRDRHFASDYGPAQEPDPTLAELFGKMLGVSAERVEALWAEEDQGLAISARKRGAA